MRPAESIFDRDDRVYHYPSSIPDVAIRFWCCIRVNFLVKVASTFSSIRYLNCIHLYLTLCLICHLSFASKQTKPFSYVYCHSHRPQQFIPFLIELIVNKCLTIEANREGKSPNSFSSVILKFSFIIHHSSEMHTHQESRSPINIPFLLQMTLTNIAFKTNT